MDTSRRTFLRQACAAASGAAWPLTGQADEPHLPPPQARQLDRYFLRIYAEGLKRESFRANYPGGFEAWQARARPQLQRLIGLEAISQQTTPHEIQVRLETPAKRGGYTIRRGAITTEPDVTIPFWLLRPEGDGPFPLAILPHGHRSNGHDLYAGVYSNDVERERGQSQRQ